MKLYTEEQVRKALIFKSDIKYITYSDDNIVDSLTPIELPSDEEIKTYLNNHSYEFENGFKDAIEFIKNKIQGGNKWATKKI